MEATADKPRFHVQPASGWINDPNGPLVFNGTFHLFFQHLPNSAKWDWGLVWGHALSKDLVHWQLVDHAIEPTAGSVDSDGCFSGCAAIDADGTPCLLYTGVRLRGNAAVGPNPPTECDLQLPFIESQCIVYAEDPQGDWRLPVWRKSAVPVVALPPPNMHLAGWRDPYVIGPPSRRPGSTAPWTMILGSGIKEKGGCVLVYRSHELSKGWKLAGELCSGRQEDGTGIVWECPLMTQLAVYDGCEPPGATGRQQGQGQQQGQDGSAAPCPLRRCHFFSISPDACTNPTLYYLGDLVGLDPGEQMQASAREHAACASTTVPSRPSQPDLHGYGVADETGGMGAPKFLIKEALGPHKLDLGDVLYAPNTLMDSEKGRVLLWAWMQEARKLAGTYTYAGCLCLPRELWLDYSEDASGERPHLIQRPLAEIVQLRGRSWCYLSLAALPTSWAAHMPALSDAWGYHKQRRRWRAAGMPGSQQQQQQHQGKQEGRAHGCQQGGQQGGHGALACDSEAVRHSMAGLALNGLPPLPPPQQRQQQGQQQQGQQQQQWGAQGPGLSNGAGAHEAPGGATAGGGCGAADDGEEAAGVQLPAPSAPLLLGPGHAFAVPEVEGPFLELEVVLQWVDGEGGRPQAAAAQGAQGGGQEQGPGEGEGGGVPALHTAELEAEGVRRESGERPQAVPAPPAGACSGVLLRSFQGVEGAAAVLYCWQTGVLEVVFEALDPVTHEFSLAAPGCRRVGGKLQRPPAPGQPIALRLFLDYSLLEVFTGMGEVLSTRVYRGVAPPGAGAGVEVVSVCCTTHVLAVAAYEVASCWAEEPEEPLPLAAVLPEAPEVPAKQPPTSLAVHACAPALAPQEPAVRTSAFKLPEAEGFEDRLLASLGIDLYDDEAKAHKAEEGEWRQPERVH